MPDLGKLVPVRSELYLFDEFSFSYAFAIVIHNILSRPFGSHSRQRKKGRKKEGLLSLYVVVV